MRILFLASFARSLEVFRGRIIAEVLRRGHEVHAVAPDLSRFPETVAFLDRVGAVWHDIPLDRTGRNPLADARLAVAIHRLLTKVRPDVMFAYTIKPVVWGTLAAAVLRVPRRVVMLTGLGYAFSSAAKRKSLTSLIVRWLLKRSLARATTIILQNRDDLEECLREGFIPANAVSLVVDGSGVDVEVFTELPLLPETPIRFLLIARLLGDKGIREYAAAARAITDKYPDVEFHLVGGRDPSPDGLSESQVMELVQSSSITWHGEVADVRPHLAACHVYVLPSYREGLPRSTQEAMATGRAVITTDVPGCRETVIDGVNGFLVPPRDPVALADAMERFIDDPDLLAPMGAESRRMAVQRFDVRLINEAMLRILEA